jgi:EmrB/QacA subfamily drug resistance transporter
LLVAMGLAIAMLGVDGTALSVALPDLQRGLDLSDTETQWAVNAYLVGLTSFVVTGGRCGDLFGHRRMFLCGLAVFVAMSALCGAAPDGGFLIAARAVQGAAAGFFFAGTLALIAIAFPVEERPRAMGIWGLFAGLSTAAGPIVGGALVDAVDWRAIFYINVPIGIACAAVTLWAASESRVEEGAKAIDWPGLVLVTVGLSALVIGVIQSATWGWASARTIGLLALAVLMLVAFVAVELRTSHPLVDMALFRIRAYVGCSIIGFVLIGLFYAFLVHISLYLQIVQGRSPIATGLMLIPYNAGNLIASRLTGRLGDRLGPRPLILGGTVLAIAGLVMLAFVGTDTPNWYLWIPFALLGVGTMLAWAPLGVVVTSVVPAREVGAASGMNIMFRNAGGAVVLALTVALTQIIERAQLADISPAAQDALAGDEYLVKGVLSGSDSANAAVASLSAVDAARVRATADSIEATATGGVMWMLVVLAVVSLVAAALTLPRGRLAGGAAAPQEAPATRRPEPEASAR